MAEAGLTGHRPQPAQLAVVRGCAPPQVSGPRVPGRPLRPQGAGHSRWIAEWAGGISEAERRLDHTQVGAMKSVVGAPRGENRAAAW